MRDITPDNLHVTGKAAEFLDELEPGDVLLFQGADFLAGLAQLTERRTCYHSALYLGTAEREGRTVHLLAHNVSMLWWRDLAKLVPGRRGSLNPPDGVDVAKDEVARAAFFEVLARNLVEHHLHDAFGLGPDGLLELARQLVEDGGVGVVSIEGYLDRRKPEKLYGRDRSQSEVHHVRSVVALRHRRVCALSETATEVAGAVLRRAAGEAADEASGFNAAELMSVVPDCFDRPGYLEWWALQALAEERRNRRILAWLFGRRPIRGATLPSAREMIRERLRTIDPTYYFPENKEGPGWICASYVIATYALTEYALRVGHVDGVALVAQDGRTEPLSTPRDLWDCIDLTPVAMFVRGPERWQEEPLGTSADGREAHESSASTDALVEPAVFVEHTTEPVERTARITADLDVPAVAGPATPAEAQAFAIQKVEWRWSVAPDKQMRRTQWRITLRAGPRATRDRISEQLRALQRRAFGNAPADDASDIRPFVDLRPDAPLAPDAPDDEPPSPEPTASG